MINSHIHIFDALSVPNNFLPFGLVYVVRTDVGFAIMKFALHHLIPGNNDLLDRYLKFIEAGKLGSQQKIFEECRKWYPTGTKFIILPMDMTYMGAGKVNKDYSIQLKELSELNKIYPEAIPFIGLDPRRPELNDLFDKYVVNGSFKGVKLYPSLGYFPYDKILYPYYKYCEENNIPILAHCSPANPVHNKSSKKEIIKLLQNSLTPINTKGTKVELCSQFTHPSNYEFVMKDFPNLKINCAHWGSQNQWDVFMNNPSDTTNWFSVIKNMIIKYPNFYTDISFTMGEEKYFALLKVMLQSNDSIKNKVLFGSDYYMNLTDSGEMMFGVTLRAYLGEDLFNQIAEVNPGKFLSF